MDTKNLKKSKIKLWTVTIFWAVIIFTLVAVVSAPFIYTSILISNADDYISQLRLLEDDVIFNDHNAELIELSNKIPMELENKTGALVPVNLKYVHKLLGVKYPGLLPCYHMFRGNNVRPFTYKHVSEFVTVGLEWNHDIKNWRLGSYSPSIDPNSTSYQFNTFALSYIGLYEHAHFNPRKIDSRFICGCKTSEELLQDHEKVFFYIKKEHEKLLADRLLEWRKPYSLYMKVHLQFSKYKLKLIDAEEIYYNTVPRALYLKYNPFRKRIDYHAPGEED